MNARQQAKDDILNLVVSERQRHQARQGLESGSASTHPPRWPFGTDEGAIDHDFVQRSRTRLEHLLVRRGELSEHEAQIREFYKRDGLPFSGVLSEDETEQVAERGLDALSLERLAWLVLNPEALKELSADLAELDSPRWWSANEAAGRELLQAMGREALPDEIQAALMGSESGSSAGTESPRYAPAALQYNTMGPVSDESSGGPLAQVEQAVPASAVAWSTPGGGPAPIPDGEIRVIAQWMPSRELIVAVAGALTLDFDRVLQVEWRSASGAVQAAGQSRMLSPAALKPADESHPGPRSGDRLDFRYVAQADQATQPDWEARWSIVLE